MTKLTFNKKSIALILAGMVLVGGIVGGTLAWLTSTTEDVINTFTGSDIDIELEETTDKFKMIPGWTIDKDPVVKVKAGSEDCYVFLTVNEMCDVSFVDDNDLPMGKSCTFSDFIAYAIDDHNWTALDGYPGIYYCIAENIKADRMIKVLGPGEYEDADGLKYTWNNNQVLTKPEVTKEMMDALTDEKRPELTFTAYAVQLWKSNKPKAGATEEEITKAQFTPTEAWEIVMPQD